MLIDFFGIVGNTMTILATIWVSEGTIIDSPDPDDIGETVFDLVVLYADGTETIDGLSDNPLGYDPDDDFQTILEKIDELEDDYGDQFEEYGWN